MIRSIRQSPLRTARSLASTTGRPSFSSAASVDDPPAPNTETYPRLFAPLDLGPAIGVLPNRALMGSMHTGLEGHSMPGWLQSLTGLREQDGEDHFVRMAEYFRQRAQGGVGIMVTGGVS